VQNEPNLGHRQEVSGGDAQPTKRRNIQNEPNSARPEAADEEHRAKRTQFLAERGRDETSGAWDEGPIVQNKANLAGP
jgi:hypothetical protein